MPGPEQCECGNDVQDPLGTDAHLLRGTASLPVSAALVVARVAVLSDWATDRGGSLTQYETTPIAGAAAPAPAVLTGEAIVVGRAVSIGGDALTRLFGIRTRADLPVRTALAVAARCRGTTLPAARLQSLAAIAAAMAVETDFVRPAAEIVSRIGGAAAADQLRIAAKLRSRMRRPLNAICLDEAVGAAGAVAQRLALPTGAARRAARVAAHAAMVRHRCQMLAAFVLIAVLPTRLAATAAMATARPAATVAIALARGANAATSGRGVRSTPRQQGGGGADGSHHRAPGVLGHEGSRQRVESQSIHDALPGVAKPDLRGSDSLRQLRRGVMGNESESRRHHVKRCD
jgi:hypothetical protein